MNSLVKIYFGKKKNFTVNNVYTFCFSLKIFLTESRGMQIKLMFALSKRKHKFKKKEKKNKTYCEKSMFI